MNKPISDLLGLIVLIMIVIGIFAVIRNVLRSLFGWQVIYDYQHGLLYDRGKLSKVLGAGKHFLFRPWQTITPVDLRETTLIVPNQEIVCADTLSLRFSSAIVYKITDAALSVQTARSLYEILYLELQLALREAVSAKSVEEVIAQRTEISQKLVELLTPKAAALGVGITAGGIKDITMPADVRKIYSQVIQAEKSAQANMAKSRAEVASLRALANAAKMIDSNPNLLQLRTLQSISELSGTPGNTFVIGVPPAMVPLKSNGQTAEPVDAE